MIPPDQNGSFVANMEMVLDVYKRPFDPLHPIICMDESPKQLISETRKPIPAAAPDGLPNMIMNTNAAVWPISFLPASHWRGSA